MYSTERSPEFPLRVIKTIQKNNSSTESVEIFRRISQYFVELKNREQEFIVFFGIFLSQLKTTEQYNVYIVRVLPTFYRKHLNFRSRSTYFGQDPIFPPISWLEIKHAQYQMNQKLSMRKIKFSREKVDQNLHLYTYFYNYSISNQDYQNTHLRAL